MSEFSGHDSSVVAFPGASHLGIKNLSFQSAGKDMNVYENCNISVNAAAVESEDEEIELFRKVADWLTSTSFRNIHSDALDKRTQGTGLWFTQTREYRLWTRNNLKVLWGTGMPGAGKTILSALIVDHLQKEFSSQKRVPVIFAYCRYTEQYPTSQFLAAWIRQLLEYDPTTLRYIKQTFAIHQRQETWPSGAELHDLLSVICSAFEKVYIVLDGLDEAQEDVKIRLLEEINTLPSNTRTLIMSRPLRSFECLVPGAAHIDIEARNEDIELFVEKKIAQMPRLRTMLAKKESERHRICKVIKEKSGGMFLVASLQIEALKGSMSPRALMNALETLPTSINDLYRHTLKRIEAQSEPEVLLAKRAILWLVYALEPLSMNRLQHALATSLDLEVFDEDDIVSGEFIFDVCCGLVSRSHDSVYPYNASPLRLIHYTAHDFLKEACLSWFPAPHTFLSSICVVYLSAQLRHRNYPHGGDASQTFTTLDGLRPFLYYAYMHWGKHSLLSGQEMGLSTHVSQFVSRSSAYPWKHGFYFDELGPHHLAALHGLTGLLKSMAISCGVTPKHRFTLLHLAAIGGHVESARIVLERWPEMSIRDRSLDGRTPLMLAAAYNHEGMVKYLLSIDPEDFETLNAKGGCGCTALASAINRGHTKIVELLASCQGIRLNIQTCTRSPLSWAASEGHISLLRRFLSDPEIEVNAQHPFTGYTALCYACRLGCPETVEILLSRKEVDVQSGPLCGCTPLLLAVSSNHLTIVSLLLSNPNINIHARCTHRGTAMSITKNDTLLKLLLSHEQILTNATDGDVRLCLQHATRLGLEATFSKVVHAALQSYGRIPAHAAFNDIHLSLSLAARLGLEDIFSKLVYGTLEPAGLKMQPIVLVEAARHGHAAVVEVALRFVDVNSKDALGMTALDAAAQAGHTHIVSLLLSHKASVTRKPLTLNTPVFRSASASHGAANTLLSVFTHNHGDSETLFAACRGGIDEVVRILLLNPNINVNMGDDRGWTPLTHAAFNNRQNICHMLLSHPKIQLSPGNASPLVQAASRGHEKVVEMLLQPTYALDINVNVEDARGWTPLAHAVCNNRRNICSMLLAHPEIQLCAGKAPLLVQAASRGCAEVVEMLLRPTYELGIDVNMEDEHGWTPLAYAAWNNHRRICHMLLAHPKIQLCAGKASPLVRAAFRGHCEIVQMLLQPTHGLDTSVTEEGWSVLSAASYSGSMPLVQALLARDDIDVNLGRPPLIVAVVKGHIPIIKILLAHCRTNVNIRDSSRHDQPGEPTALFFACRRGPPEAVQALLQHPDISVNVRLNKSSSPVSHSTQPNHSATNRPQAPLQSLEVVWRRDCPPISPSDTFSTPLHVAARAVDWHEILLLLLEAKDLDLGTLNEKGESALALMLESITVIGGNGRIALFPGFLKMVTSRYLASSPNAVRKEPDILRRAARTGNVDVVKALLEHCDSTMNLTPALTIALALGHADVASLLLDVPGIDPNASPGHVPLAAACRWHSRSPTIVKLLLDHPNSKINPNAVTSSGYTALAAACHHGEEEIVSWLLSTKGINVNAGKYHPLMLAVQAGKGRVVAQLMEAAACTDIDVNQCAYSEEALRAVGFLVPSLPPLFRWFRAKDCCPCPQQSAPGVSPGPITVPRDLPSLNCFGRLTPRRVGPYAVGFSNGPVSRYHWYGLTYGSKKSREGDPILIHCTRVGNVGMSEAVLSHHAIKINARARCGCTALIVGSFLRRHSILDRILARPDTDPTIRCPTHNTAILAAAHRLYFDTVNKIISLPLRSKLDLHETAACGCNLFICAARSGDEETFLSFLPLTNWQDSPNTVDCKFGRTALLWASFYGQESIVRLLLSDPSVDSNHCDKDGNDGLILAVISGREEVVRTFLASPGVNINGRNASGDTALSLAMWYGYERIVCLLLARKDVDVSLLHHRFGGQ